MNRQTRWLIASVFVLNAFARLAAHTAFCAEANSRLPAGFVLEEGCPDASQTKIVLIAGSNYFKAGQHEYVGGCAVLMDLLRQTPGVFPVLALDWPRKAETFAGAKAVVFFFDGGDKHAWRDESRRTETKKLADAGVGLVCFHQGVDVPKDLGSQVRDWMGAVFEKGYSHRAHWIAEFKTFPDHPVCRGVAPFRIDDGWLYKLRFAEGMKGVTPLLRTVSPKAKSAPESDAESVISWVYERPGGGRSFTFTGCHLHSSLAEEGYRRYLTNGILWTAGKEVPTSGAPVGLDTAQLDRYLSAAPASTDK
jgi:hypothetical protein